MKKAIEVNFDGLVGPSHNYAGLSFGNVASERHKGAVSYPRQAALQGLRKMKFLHDLGLTQGVLPPLPRPYLPLLQSLGFSGTEGQLIQQCAQESPELLPHIYSASCMWTANAATVSASADTEDGKVHFTPANLVSNLHRSLEPAETGHHLKQIFADDRFFHHHPALPSQAALGDEGAANFMRFCGQHGESGLEVMVYGEKTRRYPARQTRLSCEALLRSHGVKRAMLVEQKAEAIDAGVFHNDVIAVANENAILYHEDAFARGEAAVDAMEENFGQPLQRIKILREAVSLQDAVSSYLFNSQLITLPDGGMAIIAPQESQDNPRVHKALQAVLADSSNQVEALHFLDLRESMQNGGGPACLRLRVALTEEERQAVHPGILFSEALYEQLTTWVESHYRETLHPKDLADPQLMEECQRAYLNLMKILDLQPVIR
jgi:succinylarginine dihydrolase